MKISVITVTYNSATTLADTLLSVKLQTYSDIEHIIIDGGSCDSTLEIINTHGSHISKLVSEPDKGIYYAMNKGLALATGDVVGFLNSDDMFSTTTSLSEIANQFVDKNIDAVYGDLIMVNRERINVVRRFWRPGSYKAGACTYGWMAPHPTLYVRRSILLQAGGFNTCYRLQADFDLELRLFECMKIRTYYLPIVLIRMRMGGATTGSIINIIRGNIEATKSVEKNGFNGGIKFIAKKIFMRLHQFWKRPAY